MEKEKILVSWSGGKDSAISLYEVQKSARYAVEALVTTVTEGYDRISMHGVRRLLLEEQAASLGIPLEEVYISKASSIRSSSMGRISRGPSGSASAMSSCAKIDSTIATCYPKKDTQRKTHKELLTL